MSGIKIKGTGLGIPSKIVTNEDLTKIVETNEEWILSRTGIRTRCHLAEGETVSALTVQAAQEALRDAGVRAEEVGICIVATVTPDTVVPSAACRVQSALRLPADSICFDLNAACTGFLFALHTMECLLRGSAYKYGLVIGAENLSRVIDWTDRGTCILFGDGAGAAVVEFDESWPSIGAVLGCHGEDQMLRLGSVGSDTSGLIHMEGANVFKFAIQAVPYCVEQTLRRSGKTVEDVDFFVFHQANSRIIDAAVKRYRIPPEKVYKNIQDYGNTSAASIPLVLGELCAQGRIGAGNRVLVVGFGGGLTWGGALVEFTERNVL